jgi:enoyl-CoA hydratase/carnithine racemase
VALDWLLSGEGQPAERALAAGFLSRVVDDDDLESAVASLADRVAAHDPAAVQETKRLFRRLRGLDRATAEAEAIAGAVAALLRA